MSSYSHSQATSSSVRLDSLTGMRFFAALLVFFFHASLTKIIGFNPFADPDVVTGFQTIFSVGGWVGVSFFFVLSGFVITWSARPNDTFMSFWRRRVVKIYPNHLVTWFLAMLVFSGPVVAFSAAVPNLLMIHAWIPDINIFLSVNGPSWSLCVELVFYLFFPFMLRLVDAIPRTKLWTAATLVVVGLAVCQLAISILIPGQPHIPEYPISLQQWWLAYFFPPFRLFEFALGMVMARLLRAGQWPKIGLAPALLLMLIGYAGAMHVPFLYSLNLVTLIPIAILITTVADRDVRGKPSFFANPIIIKLGEISFAFYMIHLIVMTLATKALGGRLFEAPLAAAIVLATLLVSLLAGWLLFAVVEQPAVKRWGRAGRRSPILKAVGS